MQLFAGMPSPHLTDIAKLRIENISFFLAGFLLSALFIRVQSKAVLFVMADGTVRAVRPEIDSNVLRALATPRGGEMVQLDELE